MTYRHFPAILLLLLMGVQPAIGQVATLSGRVVSDDAEEPIEFASILLSESGLWAITDERGRFAIKNVPHGKLTLTVQCLGYQKRTWPMTIQRDVTNLTLRLREDNLKLDEVMVVARRKSDEATTSYTIDHTTLDN